MKITLAIFFIFLFVVLSSAQHIEINSVNPRQNIIGAPRSSNLQVFVNYYIEELDYDINSLFRVYGSNSGLINGTVKIDSVFDSFIFIPDNQFFCGEIINVSFGPLVKNSNTLKTFNWHFTVEIRNLTNATFDSLSRFNYPSFSSITYDYNKDGYIDIVSGTGRVIYNDGKGNFTLSEQIPEMYDVGYLVDINNDNIVDIISAGKFSNEVTIYLGITQGNYLKHQILYPCNNNSGSIIAAGDIQGDGFTDLISEEFVEDFSNQEFYVLWRKYINDGTGKFIRDSLATSLERYITQAQLVDIDNDGDLDLVLLKTFDVNANLDSTGTYIYYNNGDGQFSMPLIGKSLTDIAQLFVIDYDRNGLNDVASFGSVGGGAVLLQESLGVFKADADKSYFSSGENLAFFTSGDVNGDGRFDIIVSNYQGCKECGDTAEVTFGIEINSPELLFNYFPGKRSFNLGQRKDVGVAVVPLMADVDNDNDLDIIHTGFPTTVTYNRNTSTSVGNEFGLPISFELFQNYPNPFNPSTTIEYTLDQENKVSIVVYDLLGRKIKELFNGRKLAGRHKVTFNALGLSSGVYFVVLNTTSGYSVKKITYLK